MTSSDRPQTDAPEAMRRVGHGAGSRVTNGGRPDEVPATPVTPIDAGPPRSNGSHGSFGPTPASLSRTIEAEVIPRLMLTLRTAHEMPSLERVGYVPSDRDVREAVRLSMAGDASAILAFVAVLRARGASLPSIYLDLLAPAARALGTMWEQDECDFVQVTLGLGRLHQVLQACSPDPQDELGGTARGERVLLTSVPGEQHTFGLLIVSDFCRRAGLDVWTPILASEDELGDIVDRTAFALVGFSLSAERHLDRLSSCIARVRASAQCASARILVGGRPFATKPELATKVGADGTADDGADAAALAQRLVLRRV